MKKILLIQLMVAGCILHSQAQMRGDNLFSMAWNVSFPTNNNFLTKTSYAGFRFDYKKFIKDNISVGALFSWQSYEEYIPQRTYNKDRTAVHTDMDRTIYNVPFALTTHYYFKGGKMVRPYAGLGIGAQYSEQSIYYNIYVTDNNNWGFLLKPEVGAILKLKSGFGILLCGSYAWSTNKNDAFKIDNLTDFSLHLGLAWFGR